MLWRRTAPSLIVPRIAPVPDADRLRLAALQASWNRGRWVARRRVMWRWLLWATMRYVAPALALSALAGGLWWSFAKDLDDPTQLLARWMESATATQPPPAAEQVTPAPMTQPAPAEVAPTETQSTDSEAFSPEGELLPTPLTLKLEPRWGHAPTGTPAPAVSTAPSDAPNIQPSLKPENWLHSKEP